MMANRGLIVISVLFLISMISRTQCYPPGYSYAKFMGPVSGLEQKVVYDDGKYHHDYDYVAKPDYHFEYGVQDPKSKVHQSRQETRNGDTVHGEYSVLDPDGKFRTVKYTADKKNGFHASIITDGHVVHHPQEPIKPNYGDPVYHTPHVPQEPPHDEGGGEEGGGDEEEYAEGDDEEEEGDEGGGDEEEEYVEGEGEDDDEEDEYY